MCILITFLFNNQLVSLIIDFLMNPKKAVRSKLVSDNTFMGFLQLLVNPLCIYYM